MQGLHLTADLHRCAAPAALLADLEKLRVLALGAVATAGLTPVGDLFHAFAPGAGATDEPTSPPPTLPAGGVTGVVLLAESHLALHTWPELAAVTLDVYVCNHAADNSERAEALLAALEAAFEPADCERRRVQRGNIGASAFAPAA